ncbi:MAG TPA: hypothetical protein VFX60_19160 [Micromonospora sp.]|nr:hypothetical protein [Micromonospora sp.]
MIRATGHLLRIYQETRVDALIDDPGGNPDAHALQAVLDIVEPAIIDAIRERIRAYANNLHAIHNAIADEDNLPTAEQVRNLLRLLAVPDGPLALPPATTLAQAHH